MIELIESIQTMDIVIYGMRDIEAKQFQLRACLVTNNQQVKAALKRIVNEYPESIRDLQVLHYIDYKDKLKGENKI